MLHEKFKDLNLIRKIAWSFHNTTGIEIDELIGEASLAYCKALETYDPSRGKLSTHAWQYMRDELINFLKQEKEYHEIFAPIEAAWSKCVSPTPFFDTLTAEAYEIAKLILRSSKKFTCLDIIQAEERIRILLEQKGWSEHKINYGIICLKKAFQ